MIAIAFLFVHVLCDCFKSRRRLQAEVLVLRHQLNVLRQCAPRRPYLTRADRALFVWLYRRFPRILDAITIVRPETIVRWHRMGFYQKYYSNGFGVAQDYAKAREWYEKAADKGDASAMTNLEKLRIREAAGAGRNAEALQLQEVLAAKVEAAEPKREGKPGEETAQALIGVVRYAVFAREFTNALTFADRAHALLPDDVGIETNRAHALMFLEREKEAKALYLAHKSKPLSRQYGGQLWERAIVEDFAEFRKAGLTHPMMADIEKELGVSPDGD